MAPGRFMTLLFGAVLALAADNASAAQPCVVVSDVSSSVPCPCVGGENGVTLGFTLANECPTKADMFLEMRFHVDVLAVTSPSSPSLYSISGNSLKISGIMLGQQHFEVVLDTCYWLDNDSVVDGVKYEDTQQNVVDWEAVYDAVQTAGEEPCPSPAPCIWCTEDIFGVPWLYGDELVCCPMECCGQPLESCCNKPPIDACWLSGATTPCYA